MYSEIFEYLQDFGYTDEMAANYIAEFLPHLINESKASVATPVANTLGEYVRT
ncbi:hypothetical protein GCM10011607_12460 [Shewanella inventionis]|uniref:Uncharacterized protein n=1 Tax=Shewanella inventionis TaxID=1738770 RepID=A0ABQ1IX74_9GAMM|nr:hypothetical protein [Shewanella inventionis]GGB53408.1 hypothetical protein GCM10011607_12460 [Shewanella inventionis]